MKATGATNPINTGTAQTSQASPQRTPRNGTGKASAAAVKAWRALTGLEAVRQSRVYYLGGARYTIPGPRIVETLDALENCLYPDGEAPPS